MSKFLSKQDLKSVPFHILHEKTVLASQRVEDVLIEQDRKAHVRFLERKEQEWTDTHEAPFEGNMEDLYPFTPPSQETILREKRKASELVIKEVCESLGLKEKAMWLLPQVTAYIAKMKLNRNEEGKIDPVTFLRDNFRVDDWHKGLVKYCTVPSRGLICGTQYQEQYRSYSALVPLLMMPFKKFEGIEYSEWSTDRIENLVDPSLFEAMTYSEALTLSPEQILLNREHGLQVKSGPKMGEMRNPASTFKLYGALDKEFSQMPWLCQVMAAQIWIAHPVNRTNMMILDWLNWDKMSDPLIDIEVLPKTRVIKSTSFTDLPWDA